MDAIFTALVLAVPLIFSGSLHMLVVSQSWLQFLVKPIHKSWFGANKTWRGVVIMTVLTIPGVVLAQWLAQHNKSHMLVSLADINPINLGLALGMAYCLAELPNSWLKRKLGIPPGARAEKNAFYYSFMDQADSAIGCSLVYIVWLQPNIIVILWMVFLGPIIHVAANLSLYSLGWRKQPF